MNKSKIKNFAINARIKLIEAVKLEAAKLGIYEKDNYPIDTEKDSGQGFHVKGIEHSFEEKCRNPRETLVRKIKAPNSSYEHVMEEVAYTWFNRFIALKFMEMNNYLEHDLNILISLTPTAIASRATTLFNLNKEDVFDFIQNNKDDELFKTIVIAQCNALNPQLPFLFEKINDCTELLFPSGMLNQDSVIRQMNDIDEENWKEVEIIGWMYQYYITDAKAKLDEELKKKKGRKVEKDDLPIKTQLFTPKWIVKYLVENSVGKFWLESHPNESLEAKWKYYIKPVEQEPLEKIIDKNLKPEDIKILDPCCGSGHILVYAFDLLYQIYKKAGYSENEIAEAILKNNLYGLDICERAVQLASFAVLMKAMEVNKGILNKNIELNICCIQETNSIAETHGQMKLLLKDCNDKEKEQIRHFLMAWHNAKLFGSAIDEDHVYNMDLNFWINKLKKLKGEELSLFNKEDLGNINLYQHIDSLKMLLPEFIKQTQILKQKYEVVITNPPYLGKGFFNKDLNSYIEKKYPNSKTDLCAICLERLLKQLKENGHLAMVTMQSWMFLSSYEKLRNKIINYYTLENLIQIGYNSFPELNSKIAQGCGFIINNSYKDKKGFYLNLNDAPQSADKNLVFLNKTINKDFYSLNQKEFKAIAGSPIAYWISDRVRDIFRNSSKIKDIADAKQGIATGNNEKFLRFWFEVSFKNIGFSFINRDSASKSNLKWFPCNKGGDFRKWFGNNLIILNWYQDGFEIRNYKDSNGKLRSRPQNLGYMFKEGLTWSTATTSELSLRYTPTGFLSETKGSVCYLKERSHLEYLLGFLNCKIIKNLIKIVSPTIDYHEGPLSLLPIELHETKSVNNIVKNSIQISKIDWDSYETSWDFKEHPLLTHNNGHKKIQDAFNHWQDFVDKQFYQLKSNEEELNKIFIEIYGLQDELTPEVEDKDVTVKKPLSCYQEETQREKAITEDVKSFLSYAVGCMMGRYSLDQEGLAYAGGEFDKTKYKIFEVDDDAILPVLGDCWFEDDIVTRFKEFVKVTFGEKYLTENLEFIAKTLGKTNKESSEDRIRSYFLKDFFKDHCRTYKKRPIYWMFTSGKEKAFNALIYMHRYDKQTLARLRKDYLHELQAKVDRHIEFLETNNEKKKLSAMIKQKEELRKYEELLKHYADQQIEIDLDDGVKLNYALFDKLVEKI